MPRSMMMSAFAIALTAMPAHAADLPVRSRLGAVFAEPAEAATVAGRTSDSPAAVWLSGLAARPLPGYYGRPKSFAYSSYYGSSPDDWASRLPYACHFYGYC
jgi:hypothetical protein